MEKNASEITKLTERIAKDPKSKLFVPLAEEYKKIGDIDMAVMVLQEGLANNPGYVTARSFLGRLLLENGDLVGAQKELEEVIKTIPDNLLAQRKLGDLFILLHRNIDGLQRYKAALALNPGDKEVAALVADLEAGKDVADRVPKPKAPKPPAEEKSAAAKPAAASPAAAGPAAAAKAGPKPASAGQPAMQHPSQAAGKFPQPAAAPDPSVPKPRPAAPAASTDAEKPAAVPEVIEAVEEIIEIEPLEPSAHVAAGKMPGRRSAAEQPKQPKPPAPQAPPADTFDLSEPGGSLPQEPAMPEPVPWEPEPAVAAVPPPQEWTPPAEESSDDINTNTLAELYITQGFYEKAIEIYEGMLAERPGNQALQRKLNKIRDMAGVAEQNAAFTVPSEAPADDAARKDPFAPVSGGAPAGPQTAPEPTADALRAAAGAEPPSAASEPPAGPQGPAARRKETIDRLESWLKNVIKEKP